MNTNDIEDLRTVALNAITHLAIANYDSREEEARQRVNEHFDKFIELANTKSYAVALMFVRTDVESYTDKYSHRLVHIKTDNPEKATTIAIDKVWKGDLETYQLFSKPVVLEVV